MGLAIFSYYLIESQIQKNKEKVRMKLLKEGLDINNSINSLFFNVIDVNSQLNKSINFSKFIDSSIATLPDTSEKTRKHLAEISKNDSLKTIYLEKKSTLENLNNKLRNLANKRLRYTRGNNEYNKAVSEYNIDIKKGMEILIFDYEVSRLIASEASKEEKAVFEGLRKVIESGATPTEGMSPQELKEYWTEFKKQMDEPTTSTTTSSTTSSTIRSPRQILKDHLKKQGKSEQEIQENLQEFDESENEVLNYTIKVKPNITSFRKPNSSSGESGRDDNFDVRISDRDLKDLFNS